MFFHVLACCLPDYIAQVSSHIYETASEVIREASREKPADVALRHVLKRRRELPTFDLAEISRLVFKYYRWQGWTAVEADVESRLRLAQQLDSQFSSNPGSFAESDLRVKAVPEWTANEVEMNANWLSSLQREPRLWLRAKKGQGRWLVDKLGPAKTTIFPDAVLYDGEEDLFRTPEFHAGEFEIQDISSQAVGILCDPKPGETWWDACAGEGGKLLHLSELMENKGLIWASDRAEWRLKNLKRRTARAKVFNYRAARWDGSAKLPTKTKFDGVLVDAPCSGLGTWQRNPHARWTTTLQDVGELAEIQKSLLTHIAPSVKTGGRLIYSVCTLTHAETEGVVNFFSESQSEFDRVKFELPSSKPDQVGVAPAAALTIWPQDLGGNGMFVACWRRRT